MGTLYPWASLLTTKGTARLEDNGSRRIEANGKAYLYVRGNAAIAKGAPVSIVQPYDGAVSNTSPIRVNGAATAAATNNAVGVAIAAFSSSEYAWIQYAGICDYVLTDKGIVATNYLQKDQATAGMCDTSVLSNSAAFYVMGKALDTDSGSVCPSVMLFARI